MLKLLFFMLIVRPFVLLVSGVHVRDRHYLPSSGPCIVAANHNSHLDTLVLLSLFPLSMIRRVRPVAAADYFMKYPLFAWFSEHCIGIIPLKRKPDKRDGHPFSSVHRALEEGSIVILFPEGSRGDPEKMAPFKTGIAHLAKAYPELPIIPLHLYGAGKSLPKGEALFVPFVIDVAVGEALYFGNENVTDFTLRLEATIKALCTSQKQENEQHENH